MSTTPTPSGHDTGNGEAVEIVDRVTADLQRILVADWHADQCGCDQFATDADGDLSECASRPAYSMHNPQTWTTQAFVEAALSAGLLATEQEWAIVDGDSSIDCSDEQDARDELRLCSPRARVVSRV